MTYDLDETACDQCGQPTPRLDPPAEIEICDHCWQVNNAAHIAEVETERLRKPEGSSVIRSLSEQKP